MGLNWAAGLTGAGEGMDKLGAAIEKTDELEYRNIRDANLRRYQLEDQAHQSAEKVKEREFKTSERESGYVADDEAKGIGETPRAKKYATLREEDRKAKLADEITKIEKRNEGYLSRSSSAKGMTKQTFISKALEDLRKEYREAGEDIPPEVFEQYMKSYSNQWEQFNAMTGGEPDEDYVPFDIKTDPATIRDLIGQEDE
jgi:hypothetical protein